MIITLNKNDQNLLTNSRRSNEFSVYFVDSTALIGNGEFLVNAHLKRFSKRYSSNFKAIVVRSLFPFGFRFHHTIILDISSKLKGL